MKKDKLEKLLLLFIIGGIFGFIYETIFYRIDLGYFVKRGTTFGPWVPIYAYGTLLIYYLNRKSSNNIEVFLKSAIGCGLLEFVVGFALLKFLNIRMWDYNVEILNYGNIGGFICLRSVLFFGLSGIFLMDIINPLIDKLLLNIKNIEEKLIYIITTIFALDIIINAILVILK